MILEKPFVVNHRSRAWERARNPRAPASAPSASAPQHARRREESPAVAPSGESRPWQLLSLGPDESGADAASRIWPKTFAGTGRKLADVLQLASRRRLSAPRSLVCRDAATPPTQ